MIGIVLFRTDGRPVGQIPDNLIFRTADRLRWPLINVGWHPEIGIGITTVYATPSTGSAFTTNNYNTTGQNLLTLSLSLS